jgi:hypothetical protein
MPDLVDGDALSFARLRARHVRSARQVADELLAAAADPDRLDNVSPASARMCAADVLTAAGTDQDARDGIEILRATVQSALPGEIEMAQTMLASVLAEAGDLAEAEALAEAFLRGAAGSGPKFIDLLALSAMIGGAGYLDAPVRWLDRALAMTSDSQAAPGTARPGSQGPDRHMRKQLERHKERVLELRRAVVADGLAPDSPQAVREFRDRRRVAADTIGTGEAWPTLSAGRLLWWPEQEYDRLLRQVPELGAVLGSPWRAHVARVQSALQASAGQGGSGQGASHQKASGPVLVAGTASQFAEFIEYARADPVVPSAMTAFTTAAAEKSAPVPWPPKRRAPCWCESTRRYQDCCGA